MRPARVRLVLGLSLLAPATASAQAPVTPQVQIKVDFTTTGAALRCLVGVAIARISQSLNRMHGHKALDIVPNLVEFSTLRVAVPATRAGLDVPDADAARFLEKLSRGEASAIQAPTPGRWSARRSGHPPPGFSLFKASCPPIGAALRCAENSGRRPASTRTVRSR